LSFVDAVRSALSKYATFSGRARRSEYWWFVLFNLIVSVVARLVDAAAFGTSTAYLTIIVALALLLPGLAVAVRRLHDIGKSGWWILLALVPIVGAIVLIVWAAKEGEAADNAYGSSPKAQFAPTEAGLAEA
jgi:uncharacterized membrane protein YhaH (DUF805 family)